MLIWKGWGILSIVVPVIFALAMEIGVDGVYGTGFYKTASWPMPLALLISIVPVMALGYRLNRRPARILVDPQTDEQFEFKGVHSMFWVPMQYWGIPILGIAVWLYLANTGVIYGQ